MNDDLAAFRIRQALFLFTKDGTEAHGAIDAALDPVRELKLSPPYAAQSAAPSRESIAAQSISTTLSKPSWRLIEDGRLP